MKTTIGLVACLAASVLFLLGATPSNAKYETINDAANVEMINDAGELLTPEPDVINDEGFEVDVLVHGVPLDEYMARGRRYVEALEGAEYELRVRNPLGVRVAVALSVDGMNTIDARRSSAWDSSKWVIEPYGSITIGGWQMSSARARRFYFTTERDSYGAKLGQTANLGNISAVFFRERDSRPVTVTPRPPRRPYQIYEDERADGRGESPSREKAPQPNSSSGVADSSAARQAPRASERKSNNAQIYREPNDDYAATGIGRSVRNDVTWLNLDLSPRAVASVTIRYEYRDALVRLGVFPRPYPQPDPLRRRERATGFEGRRYSPDVP